MQEDGNPINPSSSSTRRAKGKRNNTRRSAQKKMKAEEEKKQAEVEREEAEQSRQEASSWLAAVGVAEEEVAGEWEPDVAQGTKRDRRGWKCWEEEEVEERKAAFSRMVDAAQAEGKKDVGVVSDAVAGQQPPAREILRAVGPSTRGAARAGSMATQGEMRTPSSRPQRDITPLSPSVRDGQQIEADAEASDATKLQRQLESTRAENIRLYDSLAKLTADLDTANKQLSQLQSDKKEWEQQNNDIDRENKNLAGIATEHENAKDQLEKEVDLLKKRDEDQTKVISQLKEESSKLHSELKDANEGKNAAQTAKDDYESMKSELHARIDELELDAVVMKDVAGDNDRLKNEIDTVHSSLEDVFTDMVKDLPLDEQIEYLRDQQSIAPIGRQQADTNTSLHEELDGALENVAENADKTTQTDAATMPQLVNKTTQTSAVLPKMVESSTQTSIKKIADSTTQTDAVLPTMVENSTQTDPMPAPPATIKEVTKIKRVKEIVSKEVQIPVTPWWVWFVLLLGIVACFGAFAGLWRERQIWIDANDLAYERLAGVNNEGWIRWITLGTEEVVVGGLGGVGGGFFG